MNSQMRQIFQTQSEKSPVVINSFIYTDSASGTLGGEPSSAASHMLKSASCPKSDYTVA
jgi:hypothetical protein